MIVNKRAVAFMMIYLILAPLSSYIHADEADDSVVKLAWIDTADPVSMFESDIREKRLRLFSVYGYNEYIPLVGHLNYLMCYSEHVTVEPIDGTSDTPSSGEGERLNEKARMFAKQYNRLTLDHLRSSGQTKCGSGVDYDEPFHEISKYVWGPTYLEGDVYYPGNPKIKPLFTIALKDPSRRLDVSREACSILRKHDMMGLIDLEIKNLEKPFAPVLVDCSKK